jgi:hypothetical protein
MTQAKQILKKYRNRKLNDIWQNIIYWGSIVVVALIVTPILYIPFAIMVAMYQPYV